MPAGDRTGPVGSGPMTGRAAGFCAGYGVPGYANPVFGFGRRFMRGRGPGFRGGRGFGFGPPWAAPVAGYGYWGPPAPRRPEEELNELQTAAQHLKTELDRINQRISEIQDENG